MMDEREVSRKVDYITDREMIEYLRSEMTWEYNRYITRMAALKQRIKEIEDRIAEEEDDG